MRHEEQSRAQQHSGGPASWGKDSWRSSDGADMWQRLSEVPERILWAWSPRGVSELEVASRTFSKKSSGMAGRRRLRPPPRRPRPYSVSCKLVRLRKTRLACVGRCLNPHGSIHKGPTNQSQAGPVTE